MACCVSKSFCFCLNLKWGSFALGIVLLVVNVIWLCICGINIYTICKFLMDGEYDNSSLRIALIFTAVGGVRLVLHTLFTIPLVIGIFMSKRRYLNAFYPPQVICCIIQIIMFIIGLAYYGPPRFDIPYIIVVYTADIITIFASFYFLFLVRSLCLQPETEERKGCVYSTELTHTPPKHTLPKHTKSGITYA